MRGSPQVPRVITHLDAASIQAVMALREALRSQRQAQKRYDEETRSRWMRETTLLQLRRALGRAVTKTAEARANLDIVLLGEDDE
jgi:hypothetical protein